MISTQELHDLLNFKAGSPEVVSLYLEIDPQGNYPRHCRTLIQEALAKDPLFDAVREDCELIARQVEGWDPGSRRGLAVFSSRRSGFWRTLPLPQPVASVLRAAPTPYLAPLHNLLDQHHRYGIALVTPEKARTLEVFLGEIREHLAEEGARAAPPPISDPLQRHLKGVADRILDLARKREWDRLVIGGPEALQPLLMHHLHTHLQDHLIVDPQMDIGMALPDILERVATGERESRKVLESVLVHRLLDAVKSGGMGVVGMAQTLRALHLGQVRMLLLRDGLAKMGRLCPHCGALALSGKRCVYCWLDTEPIINLLGAMVQKALDQSCEVFRIFHNRRLDAFGGLGAELRFKAEDGRESRPEAAAQSPTLEPPLRLT